MSLMQIKNRDGLIINIVGITKAKKPANLICINVIRRLAANLEANITTEGVNYVNGEKSTCFIDRFSWYFKHSRKRGGRSPGE